MSMKVDATCGRDAGRGEMGRGAALLDVKAVAVLLGCSSRHVYRLCDAGKMPAPVRLARTIGMSRAMAAKRSAVASAT